MRTQLFSASVLTAGRLVFQSEKDICTAPRVLLFSNKKVEN